MPTVDGPIIAGEVPDLRGSIERLPKRGSDFSLFGEPRGGPSGASDDTELTDGQKAIAEQQQRNVVVKLRRAVAGEHEWYGDAEDGGAEGRRAGWGQPAAAAVRRRGDHAEADGADVGRALAAAGRAPGLRPRWRPLPVGRVTPGAEPEAPRARAPPPARGMAPNAPPPVLPPLPHCLPVSHYTLYCFRFFLLFCFVFIFFTFVRRRVFLMSSRKWENPFCI